jgi:hypothetical protein
MPEELPAVEDFVVIVDEDNREHRTQVRAVEPAVITVLRPADVVAGDPLLIGDQIMVSWPDGDNGVGVVNAQLAAIRREGADRLWDMKILGAPWREQRRGYVRAAASGPVLLTQVVDDSTAPTASGRPRSAAGELLDLSEAAVRCSLPLTEIWASRRSTAVSVSFALDGEEHEIIGRVVTSKLSIQPGAGREVVVLFDQPVPNVDRLREQVFALEQEARRSRGAS